ncbi:MAG: hypothetical protein F4X74_09195 [Acidimicrobiia bacterium]|nr:hypothetical protein [Acidimicrobiia bacterium]
MVGGADTHRDTHVGAVVDSTGRLLGSAQFRTDTASYVHLVDRGRSALRRRALDRHRRPWLRPASSTYPAGTPSSAVLARDAAAGATSHRHPTDRPRDPR